MADSEWANKQLSSLLQLDATSAAQVLDYTSSLSKDAAAEHLKALLGDSPRALEFISSYNARRYGTPAPPPASSQQPSSEDSGPPRTTKRGPNKKRTPLHQLPSRQVESSGDMAAGYKKGEGEDYMPTTSQHKKQPGLSNALALSSTPDARQLPKKTAGGEKMPPSAAGTLISDLPNVKAGSRAGSKSRTASPAPQQQAKTKIHVPGGVAGKGASTTLEDLDSAIRALELQTNPTLSSSSSSSQTYRLCTCNATRHPLLLSAPNCLSCGKIICVKEGLGPCTFCSAPLLPPAEIQAMITSLRQERGAARQAAGNAAVQKTSSAAERGQGFDNAVKHRNKLLDFQRQNALRTTIHDEAADYDTHPSSSSSSVSWATPSQRAAQLKQQQRLLREQEERAKPEWERRGAVLSIEVGRGGKVGVQTRRREVAAETADPANGEGEVVRDEDEGGVGKDAGGGEGQDRNGAFSHNPLLTGQMIRPTWTAPVGEKGKQRDGTANMRRQTWRRVQDDTNDDNEAYILDGGVYGRRGGEEEHAFG